MLDTNEGYKLHKKYLNFQVNLLKDVVFYLIYSNLLCPLYPKFLLLHI